MASVDKLRAYKSRRDFAVTSEPAGGGQKSTAAPSFVVQKHWASRLHYDFRLELDGTMKSWAIPKGPSYDPRDKRMAVQVEDHPIAYSSFEGTIPPKQYGAGKVIIWDAGTWRPIGDPRKGYRDGNLKFELHGHKLAGKWALIRMKGKNEKKEPWLLIKEKDELARPAAEFSVVDALPDSVKGLKLPKAAKSSEPPMEPATAQGETAALPAMLAPQLTTLVDGPPSDPQDWIFEIKFDGYRVLTRVQGDRIQLFTRNGNDWTAKLGALHQALATLKLPDGWYDGEIVVINDHGVPDFGELQNAFDADKTRDIVYYLFDMPYCNGRDLRDVPLEVRRVQLKALLDRGKSKGFVRFSEVFDAQAESVLTSACRLGLEGVIAKRRNSSYRSARSSDWIKLKCSLRQEFVICGWTEPRGSRNGVGALLLGVHNDMGELCYVGKVGTGFSEKVLRDLKTRLQAVASKTSPLDQADGVEGRPNWVLPTLVAEVSFSEWTSANHIRHASFHGLRTDKQPAVIVKEEPASAPQAGKTTKPRQPPSSPLPATLRVTHPDRVIDPSTGVTKMELLRYYARVGDLMVPHCRRRPVSLVRAPSGVDGPQFFQKHAEVEKMPGVAQLDPALYPGHPPLLEVVRQEGLLSAAQWNVVEFHTMNALATAFDTPDRMVFDLDPGEGVEWPMLQYAADAVHIFLTQLGLPSFLKTSGGKGLHVVVPIKPGYGWTETKDFSKAIVTHLATTLPTLFVAKSGPRNRVGRIFIDYLRNGLGATTVAAWSVRARPGLAISVPVDWGELDLLTGAHQWTIRNVQTRLDRGNDPWKAYAQSAKALTAAMKLLEFKP
jgi:bifunctional non-homologous end joining protein LigD